MPTGHKLLQVPQAVLPDEPGEEFPGEFPIEGECRTMPDGGMVCNG